jgi:hypothetical protein
MVEDYIDFPFPSHRDCFMIVSTALKRVLAHLRAILAQWPLRIILRFLDVLIRAWTTRFGYRRRRPYNQATWKPERCSTLGKGSYSGIDILASRIPLNLTLFSREHPTEHHGTELLPLPVTTGRSLCGPSGMIRSTSDSLAIPAARNVNQVSHTLLDLTSASYPYRQYSVDSRSRSTPNLPRITREPRVRLEGDPVPDSHTLGMPPSPSSSRSPSRNGRPDSIPLIIIPPQEVGIGDYAASSTPLHPDNEAGQHDPGDNQDPSIGYDVPDADFADPYPSQHRNSPAMVSYIWSKPVIEFVYVADILLND